MLKNLSVVERILIITVAALLINAHGLTAQTTDDDLAKKLVGTWEGTRATKTSPFQTLIIKSVAREDGQLVATGNYGTTDKKLPQVKINVIVNGTDVVLELRSGVGNDVDLKLVGDNELTGNIEAMRGRKRIHADLTLKKVS